MEETFHAGTALNVSNADLSARLAPHHLARLLRSLSPDVIRERGYRTIEDRTELKDFGFEAYQRRGPGLLIPQWGVDGKVISWLFRPDAPRKNSKGKTIKYEQIFRSVKILDVPPRCQPMPADPTKILWIHEGSIKADGFASHGECAVSISGVYGWRGSNEKGGTTALADWESIALRGRPMVIAFDSGDLTVNYNVNQAARRLKAFLESKGATVGVLTPDEVAING
jgi:hypothetical protein